jgi:lipid II:glycine glycyltransferase (peptidoglycan interpeptide bridge formation enzyme)
MAIPMHQALSNVTANSSADLPASTRAEILSTVFHQPWWLDAVSGGNWNEATVTSGGAVIARLPYVKKRILGVPGIGMPPLTYVLGPQLPVFRGDMEGRFSKRRALLTELIAQLPEHKYFNQICDSSLKDALPFYALGYDSALKYTLRLAPAASPELMMQRMRKQIRYDIRKAEQTLSVRLDLGIDEFCHFYNVCTQANNKIWWSRRFARQADNLKIRIYEACMRQGAGCLLAARDRTGVLRAAIMLVWGDGVMYYLLTAHDAKPEGAGSIKLLLWEGIKLAQQSAMIFDFHGLPRPGATNILTGFGGKVANRIAVTKIPPALYLAREAASRMRFGL